MRLYIMRHGPAEDSSATGRDGDRKLTASGRDRTRDVAKLLVANDEAPLRILASPLVRTRETADIVAHVAGVSEVTITEEMAPGGESSLLVRELARGEHDRVMVVGHEPDLGDLVAELVGRPPPQGMQKAMVVGIACSASQNELSFTRLFVLDPKTLTIER